MVKRLCTVFLAATCGCVFLSGCTTDAAEVADSAAKTSEQANIAEDADTGASDTSQEHTSSVAGEYAGSISAEDIKAKALSLLQEQAGVEVGEGVACSINAYPRGGDYIFDCLVYGEGGTDTSFVAFDVNDNVYAMDANGQVVVEYDDAYVSLLGGDVEYVM